MFYKEVKHTAKRLRRRLSMSPATRTHRSHPWFLVSVGRITVAAAATTEKMPSSARSKGGQAKNERFSSDFIIATLTEGKGPVTLQEGPSLTHVCLLVDSTSNQDEIINHKRFAIQNNKKVYFTHYKLRKEFKNITKYITTVRLKKKLACIQRTQRMEEEHKLRIKTI